MLVVAAGLGAALYMEHYGHVVTGMSNQIVWGTPHVFAVFLIVAASGALNVASFSSVFNRPRLQALCAAFRPSCHRAARGRPCGAGARLGPADRLFVAMTTYNFSSIFAWNIYLYTGFVAVVVLYLFVMMDRRVSRSATPTKFVGGFAFFWRFALTTGTGSIFGFLIARDAYSSAIMAHLVHRVFLPLRPRLHGARAHDDEPRDETRTYQRGNARQISRACSFSSLWRFSISRLFTT